MSLRTRMQYRPPDSALLAQANDPGMVGGVTDASGNVTTSLHGWTGGYHTTGAHGSGTYDNTSTLSARPAKHTLAYTYDTYRSHQDTPASAPLVTTRTIRLAVTSISDTSRQSLRRGRRPDHRPLRHHRYLRSVNRLSFHWAPAGSLRRQVRAASPSHGYNDVNQLIIRRNGQQLVYYPSGESSVAYTANGSINHGSRGGKPRMTGTATHLRRPFTLI